MSFHKPVQPLDLHQSLLLRWPLCQTECVMYRLALKFCMPLVHSDSAGTSGSSGLCRCLLWDNACGNLYFGLLISVAADAYRFDLKKLVKGPALPACSVVQYSVFLQLWGRLLHWVHHSQGMMDAFFSAFWYQQGGISLPVHWKNSGLGALSSGLHIPRELSLWGLWPGISLRTRPVSEQWSVLDWGHPEVLCSQP